MACISTVSVSSHFILFVRQPLMQTLIIFTFVVPEESPCSQGSSRTNLHVLVFVLVLGPQVLENCQGLRILQIVRYV